MRLSLQFGHCNTCISCFLGSQGAHILRVSSLSVSDMSAYSSELPYRLAFYLVYIARCYDGPIRIQKRPIQRNIEQCIIWDWVSDLVVRTFSVHLRSFAVLFAKRCEHDVNPSWSYFPYMSLFGLIARSLPTNTGCILLHLRLDPCGIFVAVQHSMK